MNDNGTLSYLLGDHLGSTSITANSSGGLSAEQRYKPWGENRYTNGAAPTRRQYTGQINDSEIGLYFYGARMYSSYLARFLSADTIVPSPNDPQQLNRYAYGLNNPVKYRDPSGHAADAGGALCGTGCWWALYQKYKTLLEATDPGAYRGTLYEHLSAQTAVYYDLAQGDWAGAQAGEAAVSFTWTRLATNGYFGTDTALSAAWNAGAGGAALSFSLVGGVAPNMGESVPSGENLAYTETPWDAAARAAEPKLPQALAGGSADTHVYLGMSVEDEPIYAGITNDVNRRQAEHGRRFTYLQPITESPVTRGQARAIEQALIVQHPEYENINNSISPNHSWYQDAVNWGNWWLQQMGLGQ
jgi:RHS repeat-associated protein